MKRKKHPEDHFVDRCKSCKVPNKQPAACKVRQNANSVMCWRAMNPKRATLAVDLGGRSSTAKLAWKERRMIEYHRRSFNAEKLGT